MLTMFFDNFPLIINHVLSLYLSHVQPDHYVSHLIGHEGEGSILVELRKRGWCNSLVGGAGGSVKGFGFFDITVDLTEEGFDHVDDIITLIFQYINMIKAQEPQKWIFDEYCKLNEMQFRFKEKESPVTLVSSIVHSMITFPLKEVFSVNYLLSEWRPDLIKMVMEHLYPENARIIVIGKKLKDKCTEEEKWYKTNYTCEKIDPATIENWKNCGIHENLHLPKPNPYIPTDFVLFPIDNPEQKHPEIIHDTPLMRVWFKQDAEFEKPKALLGFDFSNPIVYSDPLNANMAHLFVSLFRDSLVETLYSAELAGLRLSMSNTTSGMSLLISGYNDKQYQFLESTLDKLFSFKVNEKRFELMYEQYMRALKNFSAEQPYQLAIYYLTVILTEQAVTKKELIDAMSRKLRAVCGSA